MSLKDLFNEGKGNSGAEPLTKQEIDSQVESFDYMRAVKENNARFLPLEHFSEPKSFARFGSAEKYYEDTITRIYDTYPYDGSLKEKIQWEISSSYLDLYIFENGYPRTTGYATFTTASLTATDMYNGYGAAGTSSYEYILVKGGPNAGTGLKVYYDYKQDKAVYRKDANIYDLDNNRENNLKIGGIDGNTVEFWLSKDAFSAAATEKEVILDVFVTGTLSSSVDYGRFRIEMTGAATGSPFLLTYMSGATGFATQSIGDSITAATVADDTWHHYAFRLKNTGSTVVADLFIDGEHNDRIVTGSSVGYVSGALCATIAALGQSPSGNIYHDGPDRGYAKLSGSLDELRYWKTYRSSEKLQRYWFGQVGGGTNSDPANTDLGVYYKFNAGITQTASIDAVVLDYSGRITNGAWTGYSATYSRNTGSAIVSSSASPTEFQDPILYSFHPTVLGYKNEKKLEGRVHDDVNANKMDSFVPQWMLSENETDPSNLNKNELLNALQIMGSYFDSAALLVQKLPELKHEKYYAGDTNPPPFNKHFIESRGMIASDLFINADLLEQFENRSDTLKFEETLQEIKNTIYQNIYNNLTYINKAKGTEKAMRNLFRCFGLGDNALKFNIYANNGAYKLQDNTREITKVTNYINFNKTGSQDASVYQYRTDSNATSFISGTSDYDGDYEGSGLSFTLESDIVLPNRVSIGEYATLKRGTSSSYENLYPLVVSSSLFGLHTANGTENDLTWATNDYANFQVFAVKDNRFSSNAKFVLTGSAGGFITPELTSSFFENVYDDDLWTFAVTVKPNTYPQINEPDGSELNGYKVRFYGSNHIGDLKRNEFILTASLSVEEGRKILASHKRVYAGAHRTNFTGAVLQFADTKISEVKAWYADIATSSIDQHNMKIGSYGPASPSRRAFLYQDAIKGTDVSEIETLALRWNFASVTGSDAYGQFSVEDASSGSATDDRFDWFSGLVSRRHTASGSFFSISSSAPVQKLSRGTLQQQVPEVLLDSNLVNIVENQSDDFYTRNARPTTYNLSIEKNLFQDVSEEMLGMFATAGYLNTLIGANVNRFRGNYKELIKMSDLFFEKVDNDYDFDKYVEYFKFIDYAMSQYIANLIPASMGVLKEGVSTIVENFVLGDRNKFQHKAPVIREEIPDFNAQVLGVNELLYNWRLGHAPLNSSQKEKCLWWRNRALRTNTVIYSAVTGVNTNKQDILDSINNENNAPNYTLYDSGSSTQYSGSTYALRHAKPYRTAGDISEHYKGGINFHRNKKVTYYKETMKRFYAAGGGSADLAIVTTLSSSADCIEGTQKPWLSGSNQKTILPAGTVNWSFNNDTYNRADASLLAPFNIISSSLGPQSGLADLPSNARLTNIHHDVYGPDYEHPMQGLFTEKYVGGNQHRHQKLNTGSANQTNRGEVWTVDQEGGAFTDNGITLLNPASRPGDPVGNINNNLPRAVFFREPMAKRPINIKNIQQTTASNITNIGNYSNDYDVVLTNSRTANNIYLVETGSITGSSVESLISGTVDYTLPVRARNQFVIVNRFSAPGGPEVNSLGFLDIEAAEYSVYNALPFRNLEVRQPLDVLLSDHSKQFGYFSDAFNSASYVRAGQAYPGTSGSVNAGSYYAMVGYTDATASFHKVNRNARKRVQYGNQYEGDQATIITASHYDNAMVSHPIPQSDFQYSWITASVLQTGDILLGYEQRNFARGDEASTDITFCSASTVGSWGGANRYYGEELAGAIAGMAPDSPNFIPVDFAGLNMNIQEALTASTNMLGYPGGMVNLNPLDATDRATYPYKGGLVTRATSVGSLPGGGFPRVLNGLILHRQGPYGWPSWKQIRGDQHPIVRYQRRYNEIGYVKEEAVTAMVGQDRENPLGTPGFSGLFSKTIVNYTEPVASGKYKPLQIYLPTGDNENDYAKIVMTYGNQNVLFTDHSQDGAALDVLLTKHDPNNKNLFTKTYSPYLAIKTLVEKTGKKADTQAAYTEVIYPKEQFTYLSGSRKRETFVNDFWRSTRANRNRTGGASVTGLPNSMGELIGTASLWKLDATSEYGADQALDYITYGSHAPYSASMPTGSGVGELQNTYSLFHYGTASNIMPACSYIRRIPLLAASPTTAWSSDFGSSDQLPIWSGSYSRTASFGLPYSYAGSLGYVGWQGSVVDTARAREVAYLIQFTASVGHGQWVATGSNNAGTAPFYDTYDDYADGLSAMAQDSTILPEFRISEKMGDFIAARKGSNWSLEKPTYPYFKNLTNTTGLGVKNGMLSLTGAATDSSNRVDDFLKRHVYSDFYEHFKLFQKGFGDTSAGQTFGKIKTPRLSLGCEAIIKFLPYNGFYPSERTVQLGTLFSSSLQGVKLESAGAPADNGKLRTLLQPFFAPGILYNSVKSGLAVDYPVHNADSTTLDWVGSDRDVWGSNSMISGNFNQRINFEQIYDPAPALALRDMEGMMDARLDSTASYRVVAPAYKFAMNNFLAESVDFFLEEGAVSSITSMPLPIQDTVAVPVSGNYYLDVVLRNSRNMVDYQSYYETSSFFHSDASNWVYGTATYLWGSSLLYNTSSITMYSRANSGYTTDVHTYGSSFGPPVNSGPFSLWFAGPSGLAPTGGLDNWLGNVASFEPYTPPYYDGYSYCRLMVGLDKGSKLVSELMAEISQSYDRMKTWNPGMSIFAKGPTGAAQNVANWGGGSCAQANAMQISASLNFGQPKGLQGDSATGEWIFYNERDKTDQRLIVHPKFETPVLDFSSHATSSLTPTPQTVSGNAPVGMWHQYGALPSASEGITMAVQDPSFYMRAAGEDADAQSLASLLSFGPSNRESKIGSLATERMLSEAIVAIPFKYFNNTNRTMLYKMNKSAVDAAKNCEATTTNTTVKEPIFKESTAIAATQGLVKDYRKQIPLEAPAGVDQGIYNLLRLMRKYVMPPQFDFLHFEDVEPFVAYMWEFEVKLGTEDLQNIWQGIEPTMARKAIKATSDVITHVLPTRALEADTGPEASQKGVPPHPYFEEIFDPDKTRWAVFKVKKRARNNYANVVGRQSIDGKEYVRSDVAHPHDFAFSYNWPNDFFSLIELSKTTATTVFNPRAEGGAAAALAPNNLSAVAAALAEDAGTLTATPAGVVSSIAAALGANNYTTGMVQSPCPDGLVAWIPKSGPKKGQLQCVSKAFAEWMGKGGL